MDWSWQVCNDRTLLGGAFYILHRQAKQHTRAAEITDECSGNLYFMYNTNMITAGSSA
jgi:hypothetical protein